MQKYAEKNRRPSPYTVARIKVYASIFAIIIAKRLHVPHAQSIQAIRKNVITVHMSLRICQQLFSKIIVFSKIVKLLPFLTAAHYIQITNKKMFTKIFFFFKHVFT